MQKAYPDIDIILVSFNHEPFIERAVESILYQEYPGRIRVIVADDASQDRTVAVLEEIAKTQSRIEFEFLTPSENLGITKNYKRAFLAASADYVAVLEGDDYWASTRKILKQVDFLEEHRECAACSCNYYIKEASKNLLTLRLDRVDGYLIATPKILIGDNLIGNFSTCMYRKAALTALPENLFAATSYDWITNICVSMYGPIGILGEPLSVYRIHSEGTWNTLDASKKLSQQLELIPAYNEITRGVFRDEFQSLSEHLSFELSRLENAGSRLLFLKTMVSGMLPSYLLRPMQLLYRKVGGKSHSVRPATVKPC